MTMHPASRDGGYRRLARRTGKLVASAALLWIAALPPAFAQNRELIAVLDLRPVGASEVEASAVTDRLREELLRTGRFTLVDRSQMEAVLNEQALQQTGCTEQECAVQVGQLLGVRKIVAGKLTKISPELWQLSALMVDVETAETVRAESIQHRGDFFGLLTAQVPPLALKLTADGPQVAAPIPAPVAPPPAEPADPSKRWRVYTGWGLVGLGALVQLGALSKNDDAQTLATEARLDNDPDLFVQAQALRTEAERSQGGAFLFTSIGAGLLVYHYYFDKPKAAAAETEPPEAFPLRLAFSPHGVQAGWTWRW